MFRQVILGVDGSPESRDATEALRMLASRSEANVLVVHFREADVARSGLFDLEAPSSAQSLVDHTVESLRASGVQAAGSVRAAPPGGPAAGILAVAQEVAADLIVIGRRGRSDFAELLLGGVAHKIVHHAKCCVLLGRPG